MEKTDEKLQEAVLAFIGEQVKEWTIISNKLELSYAQIVMMFAILMGELLFKRDDDDFNRKIQAYIRKNIKRSFEAQKSYRDGLQ